MASVSFEHVEKRYPGGIEAVADLCLEVADGELLALVGPSGCGKSTVLRLLAGLEAPSAGTIRLGGRAVNELPPQARNVAMVFQDYALYPNRTVRGNLAFPLEMRRLPRDEIARRVEAAAALLEIGALLERLPRELSGGQRQRVAMGRALVREPEAFLLDEPLSNLDAKLRVQMRAELKRLHQRLGVTTVYVTHDQVEAMTLGDRIAVLSEGRLQQLGPPQEVYDRPANVFVAGFIGSPPMNLLRARATGGRVTAGELTLDVGGARDGDLVIGLRPESLRPAADGLPGMEFRVEVVEPLGDQVVVHGTVAGQLAIGIRDEEEIPVVAAEASRAPVTATFAPSVRPAVGERLRLGVPSEAVYVFDAATGVAQR